MALATLLTFTFMWGIANDDFLILSIFPCLLTSIKRIYTWIYKNGLFLLIVSDILKYNYGLLDSGFFLASIFVGQHTFVLDVLTKLVTCEALVLRNAPRRKPFCGSNNLEVECIYHLSLSYIMHIRILNTPLTRCFSNLLDHGILFPIQDLVLGEMHLGKHWPRTKLVN